MSRAKGKKYYLRRRRGRFFSLRAFTLDGKCSTELPLLMQRRKRKATVAPSHYPREDLLTAGIPQDAGGDRLFCIMLLWAFPVRGVYRGRKRGKTIMPHYVNIAPGGFWHPFLYGEYIPFFSFN
jgi:hypothetical protein